MRLTRFLTTVAVCILSTQLRAADTPLGGIGIVLGADQASKTLKVIRVIPESPAARAGLSPGLVLHSIEGTALEGKALADTVALIRGPIGSKLTLEFIDPRAHTTNQVELTRDKISAPAKARPGDPAAPLMIKEWVQGGPVDVKDGKAVYVVEFWATWCGPCRVSIPHLSALQKQFKDKGVVVVGISDEGADKVKPFVKAMGEKMDYAVACDDGGQTNAGFMAAYGFNSIPTAFIVDKGGRVRWAGHPMAGLEKALEKIVSAN